MNKTLFKDFILYNKMTDKVQNKDKKKIEKSVKDHKKEEEKITTIIFDETTIHNFRLLTNLKETQKLFLGDNNKFYVDERYFQVFRRKLDGSNRYDLFLPFFKSYMKAFVKYKKLTKDELKLLKTSMTGLENLTKTYDDFIELIEFYEMVKETYDDIQKNKKKVQDIGISCDIIKKRKKDYRYCENL